MIVQSRKRQEEKEGELGNEDEGMEISIFGDP